MIVEYFDSCHGMQIKPITIIVKDNIEQDHNTLFHILGTRPRKGAVSLDAYLFFIPPTIKPSIVPMINPAGPVMKIPSKGPWLALGVAIRGPIYPRMNPVKPKINPDAREYKNVPKNFLH